MAIPCENVLTVFLQGKRFNEGWEGWPILYEFGYRFQGLVNIIRTANGVRVAKPIRLENIRKCCLAADIREIDNRILLKCFDILMRKEENKDSIRGNYGFDLQVSLKGIGGLLRRNERILYRLQANGNIQEAVQEKETFTESFSQSAESLEGIKQVFGKLSVPDNCNGTCEINQFSRNVIICSFPRHKRRNILKGNGKDVLAIIRSSRGDGNAEEIYPDKLQVYDYNQAPRINLAPLSPPGFWDSTNLEEVVRWQGAKPVEQLSDVSGGWPEDESFDDFLKTVREARNLDYEKRIGSGEVCRDDEVRDS